MPGWLRRLLAKVRGGPGREENLVTCRDCGAEMVVPVAWCKCQAIHWWMYLRCGECGHSREVVVSDADARRYERTLDSGVDAGDFAA